MTQAVPLPSLFGRFSAILKDHDHLGTTLKRLRLMCATLESGALELPPELFPPPLLDELYSDLKAHFASEESKAYFGTVIDEAPALAPQISILEWEHQCFLATVERLLSIANDRTHWSTLPPATRELVADLERHERAESTLLRELFFPRQ
ncbi:MAG TPA: hemerythrin domain-containing protein [Polyangiaceae bacterium]|nr:hemerythrin domain-containing protein [Polyangiaceae bacterium]